MSHLVGLSPSDFVGFLRQEKIHRFYFVYDMMNKHVRSSHPQLQPLADFISGDPRDFAGHEGLFFQVTKKYDTLQGAFVHRTCRGQAAGGVRYWFPWSLTPSSATAAGRSSTPWSPTAGPSGLD